MTDQLRIEVEWLARQQGTPAERASFGEVRITVGDVVATELYDRLAKTTREHARLSVLHLGRWLAGNWWRLRWEPEADGADWRMSHELAAAGGGFLWPPLRIASDGERVTFQSKSGAATAEVVRYLRGDFERSVPAEELERATDELMDLLLARLESTGCADPDLAGLWGEVVSERSSPEATAVRRREALLGLDPDVEAIDALVATGEWMGEAALDEVMSASGFDQAQARLQRLRAWSMTADLELDASEPLRMGATARSAGDARRQPWQRGVWLARLARHELGLDLKPVTSTLLNDLLGADAVAHHSTRSEPMSAAFRQVSDPKRMRAVLRTKHPRPRRFEVARLVADTMTAPSDDRVLPITGAVTARQKVQRAFAAEFLCPLAGLRDQLPARRPDDEDLASAADFYDVSEWTVITKAVNEGLLPRDYLRKMSA